MAVLDVCFLSSFSSFSFSFFVTSFDCFCFLVSVPLDTIYLALFCVGHSVPVPKGAFLRVAVGVRRWTQLFKKNDTSDTSYDV